LARPKSTDFHPIITADKDILGLQIAVNDPLFVSRGEPASDLDSKVNGGAQRQRPVAQLIPQGLALQQFGDDIRRAIVLTDIKYG
jgi:hypothetical protein